jgi:hypothetical protein
MARQISTAAPRRRPRFFRTRRRFGWGWISHLPLPWLGALAVSLALLYVVIRSGTFTVRAISAPGIKGKEMAQIENRCRCLGKSIFVLQPDQLKQRLLGIPALSVRRVTTSLPNHIFVDAVYKPRVAVWRTPEAAYAVASDGQVLQVWKKPFPKHGWKPLPVFDQGYDSQVRKGRRLLVGEHVPVAALTMALNLSMRMPEALRPLVKQYLYRPFTGEIVVGKANWWALMGTDTSSDLDLRLAGLLSVLDRRPPLLLPGKCIDLRSAGAASPGPVIIHVNHSCG